jgi:hypothetical protein
VTRAAALALVLAACAEDVPAPPGLLELGPSLPFTTTDLVDFAAAFDPRDSLVISDGMQLVRVSGLFTGAIAGSAGVAVRPSFGFDRDGELLVGGQTTQLVRLEPTDLLTPIGPQVPIVPFFAPVATPAGNYAILGRPPGGPLRFTPGATSWTPGPDLSRTFRAGDGTLYAIVEPAITRLAADDTPVALATCADTGTSCAALALGGLDGAGQLFVCARGDTAIHAIDSGGGVHAIDLPSVLQLVDVRATAASVLVLASNPARGGELTLWLLAGDTFQRIDAISTSGDGFPNRLMADQSGRSYVLHDHRLDGVFLFQ